MAFGGMNTIHKVAKITGKIASEVMTRVYDAYVDYVDGYKTTQECLEKRGLNDWDEEKLKEILNRSTTSNMEKTIISSKLQEMKKEKQSEKYDSSIRRDGQRAIR